jgi:hypothetical protein
MWRGNPHRDHPAKIALIWLSVIALIVAAVVFRDVIHRVLRWPVSQYPLTSTLIMFIGASVYFVYWVRRRREPGYRSRWNLVAPTMWLMVTTLLLALQLWLFWSHMTSNNTLERTGTHSGPRLAATSASWPAAQLGR